MKRREALLAGMAWPAMARSQTHLRFALSQTWGPPYVERVGSRVVGGLILDLMTAIAAEAGMAPEFVLLPSARVDPALSDGTVDLHCVLSPVWWPELRDSPRWSVPLLPLTDVLVGRPGGPRGLDALTAGEPARIGLVRGYRYPTVQALLDAGRLEREDALDQWGALEKLMRGRTDMAVVNDTTLIAFQRRRPDSGLRQLAVVDSVPGHCLLGEKPHVPANRIHAAIQRAVAKGRVAAVLKPYEP